MHATGVRGMKSYFVILTNFLLKSWWLQVRDKYGQRSECWQWDLNKVVDHWGEFSQTKLLKLPMDGSLSYTKQKILDFCERYNNFIEWCYSRWRERGERRDRGRRWRGCLWAVFKEGPLLPLTRFFTQTTCQHVRQIYFRLTSGNISKTLFS